MVIQIDRIYPISHTVRKYFPDFLVRIKWVTGPCSKSKPIALSMIPLCGIAAKELYAAQMGFENQMRYEMVKASEAGMGQILM